MPHLRFGYCEVHLARREVRLAGRLQALPPKPYALLVTLIEQRHRVVGKHELLHAIWGRDELSPSVLGRTVMLVRRAIGDSADQPRWVQSIHGVGYRFIGDVEQSNSRSMPEPPQPAAATRGTPSRLVVLPCLNATGEPAFDWFQVGLMALAGRALAGDPNLEVVQPATLLPLLANERADDLPEHKARALSEALGLAGVVHARLTRQGPALWLDYRIFRPGGSDASGSLRGDDPAALAARMAADVARRFGAGPAAPAWRDPFIAQAWARAIEADAQGDPALSTSLAQVVLHAMPGLAEAALLHLRGLAQVRPGDALTAGARLLAQVREAGDARLQGRVHALLAGLGGLGGAERSGHRDAAHRLAAEFGAEDWALQLRLQAAAQAFDGGDAAAARALCEAVQRDGMGQVPVQLEAERLLAAIELEAGEPVAARERLSACTAGYRRLHRPPALGESLTELALAGCALGLVDAACEAADEVLSLLRDDVPIAPATLATLALVLLERQQVGRLRVLLQHGGRGDEACHGVAEAALALALGDAACAHRLLARALQAGPPPRVARAWQPTWLRLQAAVQAADDPPCAAADAPATLLWRASIRWKRQLCPREAYAQLVERLPAGREQALARLDLAWLALESADLPQADRLLSGLGAWLHQHPVGLAVQARRLHAQGQHGAAAATQAQALQVHGGPLPTLHGALRRHYTACAGGGAASTPPPLPVPPSGSWWSARDGLVTAAS